MRFLSISTPISFILQPVEAKHLEPQRHHWRHISGVSALTQSLGVEPRMFPSAPCIALSDDGEHHFSELDFRWMNANSAHPSQSPQWRLGFRGHLHADVGDLLAILLRHDTRQLAAFVAQQRSTWHTQLTTLIGNPRRGASDRVFHSHYLPEVAYLPVRDLFKLSSWDVRFPLRTPSPTLP